ncbi:hypothetical protein HYPSUDRAFT_57832 [Hypholoma sublateritium FD-334 SS-4]|uniref:SCP domain-containing protein n=1 Tax=Hypholoma sublateritium (strain FD-334 SS-4) TaxID=945553 RepID=A0A0D2M268_HYPSF|nr:hypothetical protein HYPSUDRAFT_57832 [Hypholoma sublateritium FD-334 SS-4]
MLFTRISLAALLLFVATVSSAPLHESAEGVTTHAEHARKGLLPALSRGSKQHTFAGLAAAQGVPGTPALARAASHVHVHVTPDSSLEGPADAPTQQYARSPTLLAAAQSAHLHAADAHHNAAVAHHVAARQQFQNIRHHLATGNVAAMTRATVHVEGFNHLAVMHASMAARHRAHARILGHPNTASLHTDQDLGQQIRIATESFHYAGDAARKVRNYNIE